jgi:hypothetical protein
MEEKYIFKYKEFFSALTDDLELNNKIDIIFIYTDSQSIRQKSLNENQLKRIKEIINVGITAVSTVFKIINPTERFDFSANETIFFKYYNKYDMRIVFGLLA